MNKAFTLCKVRTGFLSSPTSPSCEGQASCPHLQVSVSPQSGQHPCTDLPVPSVLLGARP